MAIIQAENVLEMDESEMFLKQYARSLKGIFSRSFMSTIKNSSNFVRQEECLDTCGEIKLKAVGHQEVK